MDEQILKNEQKVEIKHQGEEQSFKSMDDLFLKRDQEIRNDQTLSEREKKLKLLSERQRYEVEKVNGSAYHMEFATLKKYSFGAERYRSSAFLKIPQGTKLVQYQPSLFNLWGLFGKGPISKETELSNRKANQKALLEARMDIQYDKKIKAEKELDRLKREGKADSRDIKVSMSLDQAVNYLLNMKTLNLSTDKKVVDHARDIEDLMDNWKMMEKLEKAFSNPLMDPQYRLLFQKLKATVAYAKTRCALIGNDAYTHLTNEQFKRLCDFCADKMKAEESGNPEELGKNLIKNFEEMSQTQMEELLEKAAGVKDMFSDTFDTVKKERKVNSEKSAKRLRECRELLLLAIDYNKSRSDLLSGNIQTRHGGSLMELTVNASFQDNVEKEYQKYEKERKAYLKEHDPSKWNEEHADEGKLARMEEIKKEIKEIIEKDDKLGDDDFDIMYQDWLMDEGLIEGERLVEDEDLEEEQREKAEKKKEEERKKEEKLREQEKKEADEEAVRDRLEDMLSEYGNLYYFKVEGEAENPAFASVKEKIGNIRKLVLEEPNKSVKHLIRAYRALQTALTEFIKTNDTFFGSFSKAKAERLRLAKQALSRVNVEHGLLQQKYVYIDKSLQHEKMGTPDFRNFFVSMKRTVDANQKINEWTQRTGDSATVMAQLLAERDKMKNPPESLEALIRNHLLAKVNAEFLDSVEQKKHETMFLLEEKYNYLCGKMSKDEAIDELLQDPLFLRIKGFPLLEKEIDDLDKYYWYLIGTINKPGAYLKQKDDALVAKLQDKPELKQKLKDANNLLNTLKEREADPEHQAKRKFEFKNEEGIDAEELFLPTEENRVMKEDDNIGSINNVD